MPGIITGIPPVFMRGNPFLEEVTAEKLTAIGHGKIVEVAGNARTEPVAGGGVRLIVGNKVTPETRCYVITSATPTALPATVAMDAISYDVVADYTASLLGTLSGGVFTFTKPGLYWVPYTATVEMDLSGATTATPGLVTCQAELRIGGTAIATSSSATSAALTPNFNGFLKTDGGDLQQNVSGLVVETPVLTTESVGVCDALQSTYFDGGGSGSPSVTTTNTACVNAITDAELVSGKLQSTPAAGTADVTTNATVITGSTPSGTAAGVLASAALIYVKYNTSGVLKIFDGATERDPTLSLYINVTGGDADCVKATISLLQL